MGLFSFFSPEPKVYSGQLLSADDVRTAFGPNIILGKQAYAEVDSGAVIWIAQEAQKRLFPQIGHWQPDASCTLYAAKFVEIANEQFAKQAFHDPISNNLCAAAAADIWFQPDNQPQGSTHAIGAALTEKGVLFIDPQVPDKLRVMSQLELLSRIQQRML